MKINFAHELILRNQSRLDKIAYYDKEQSLSYRELCNRICQYAKGLSNLGLQQNDHVALLLNDHVDYPPSVLSLLYLGVVPILLSTSIPEELFVDIAKFTKLKLIIVEDKLHYASLPSDILVIKRSQLANFLKFDTDLEPVYVDPDSPGYMGLSSGTTGMPKIAVHRHQAFFEVAKIMPASYAMTVDTTILSVPKISWGWGMHNSITSVLWTGATGILMSDLPAPRIIFNYINEFNPTVIVTSPAILKKILANKNKKYTMSASVKRVFSAAEDLPTWVYEEFYNNYGIKIDINIGMLETANVNYAGTVNKHAPGTVGKPFPGIEINIRDKNEVNCDINQIGEIFIKSKCNAFYYYNNYDKTKETFIGEWVKSGDYAYWNNNGNIVFVGRANDVFKINDLLVSPIEVEAVLEKSPLVKQVAVLGIDNQKGNKELHAFVVKSENFTSEKFMAFAKSKLIAHQVPKYIHSIEQIPETVNNKKDRNALVKYVN